MEYVEIIRKYKELEKSLKSVSSIIGYETINGRRLITKIEGYSKCAAISNKFKLVEMNGDQYYENPMELILGYFDTNSIPVLDIKIFRDTEIDIALKWLFENNRSTGEENEL